MTFDAIGSGLFETLVGHEYDFYGIDCNSFCLGVGESRIVLEAIEDPSDGYRSYLQTIRVDMSGRIFFGTALARVRLEALQEKFFKGDEDDFKGYVLRDVIDDHAWLVIGTRYGDSYYPSFTFRYEPKQERRDEGSA